MTEGLFAICCHFGWYIMVGKVTKSVSLRNYSFFKDFETVIFNVVVGRFNPIKYEQTCVPCNPKWKRTLETDENISCFHSFYHYHPSRPWRLRSWQRTVLRSLVFGLKTKQTFNLWTTICMISNRNQESWRKIGKKVLQVWCNGNRKERY